MCYIALYDMNAKTKVYIDASAHGLDYFKSS